MWLGRFNFGIACVTLAPGVLVLSFFEKAGLVVDVFPSHGMNAAFIYVELLDDFERFLFRNFRYTLN